MAIRYRGNWFYIDDTELTPLLALQSGKVQGIIPMLTLPIGK
jgi:hypothetical protein